MLYIILKYVILLVHRISEGDIVSFIALHISDTFSYMCVHCLWMCDITSHCVTRCEKEARSNAAESTARRSVGTHSGSVVNTAASQQQGRRAKTGPWLLSVCAALPFVLCLLSVLWGPFWVSSHTAKLNIKMMNCREIHSWTCALMLSTWRLPFVGI